MHYEDLSVDVLSVNPAFDAHEVVRRFVLDEAKQIIAYIAVHNSVLGPALGGCRIKPYKTEAEAVTDVLRLSRGMTYKNAMAGLPLGGGKAVILCDPQTQKTAEIMQKFGQAVETLKGMYVTAEDSGTGEDDMEEARKFTRHVTGLHPHTLKAEGYPALGGNPSPLTAIGCFEGIKAAVRFRLDRADLKGLRAAVQGVGAVGLPLCEMLRAAGVELVVTDISELNLAKAKKTLGQVDYVRPDEIYAADADIFVPCALGGVLNDKTIPQLHVSIVAGPANNQLVSALHDEMLAAQNILYVPDYVINAGGVICVGYEYFMTSGFNPYGFTLTESAMNDHVRSIGQRVWDILSFASVQKINTGEAADKLAEEKFSSAQKPSLKSGSSCAL